MLFHSQLFPIYEEVAVKAQILFGSMVLAACFGATGCGSAKHEMTPQQTEQRAQLADEDSKVAQTAQAYKAMDNAGLLKKLGEQSAHKREPFNSLAYRELVTRKDVDPKQLVAMVNESKNGDALLPLLLLRQLDQKTYAQVPVEVKASVLTDALEKSKTFNTWGLPNFYLEDASKALLECGKAAYPALRRMLSDTRPAPVWGGGKLRAASQQYGYRLCDYALFFLKSEPGQPSFVEPAAAADRDALIKAIAK
jgi:hypothetical protein